MLPFWSAALNKTCLYFLLAYDGFILVVGYEKNVLYCFLKWYLILYECSCRATGLNLQVYHVSFFLLLSTQTVDYLIRLTTLVFLVMLVFRTLYTLQIWLFYECRVGQPQQLYFNWQFIIPVFAWNGHMLWYEPFYYTQNLKHWNYHLPQFCVMYCHCDIVILWYFLSALTLLLVCELQ
jgi:hypothetical protein